MTIRHAKEHGWLRRSELDTRTGDCWERPDGTVTLMEKGRMPSIVTATLKRKRTEADHAYLDWYAKTQRGEAEHG
jgi:hypothetical protein